MLINPDYNNKAKVFERFFSNDLLSRLIVTVLKNMNTHKKIN